MACRFGRSAGRSAALHRPSRANCEQCARQRRLPAARGGRGVHAAPPTRLGEFGFSSVWKVPPTSKCSARVKLNIIFSVSYKIFTEMAQATGPENIGSGRTLPGLMAPRPANSSSRITLENNGKIRPQPDRENAFARASGGGTGTGIPRSLVLKSLRLNDVAPGRRRRIPTALGVSTTAGASNANCTTQFAISSLIPRKRLCVGSRPSSMLDRTWIRHQRVSGQVRLDNKTAGGET